MKMAAEGFQGAPGSRKPGVEAQAVVLLAQSSEDVFRRCVDLALQITRATTSMVLLYRPALDMLEVVAASGHLAEEATGRLLKRGEALSWRVFDAGEAQIVEQPQNTAEAYFVSGRPQPGMYLGVPLLDPDGQVLGVLAADTTNSSEQLDAADAQVLLLLGQAAGVAYSRWLALERAQVTARQFECLARLTLDLASVTQPEAIARQALKALLDLSGFTAGAVFEVNAQGQAVLTVLEGEIHTCSLGVSRLREPHLPRGLVAEVLRTNSPQSLTDDMNWRAAPANARGTHTAVAAPLRSRGQVVGVIGLVHPRYRQDAPGEIMTLLGMVAARIDQALERAAGLEHLHQTREAALRALGRVLEGRDGETFGHTDRVTTLALRLGEALKQSPEALQHLRWGAYLHDIGKVAVGDDVLRKPGALTVAERQLMQRHVVVGDDMLRDEAFVPREVRAVVRHHHERWDGAGYPERLAGEAIPLLARIFSVVDVYDALISERPYKSAWSRAEALAELQRCAGTQFDPQIVDIFLQLESGCP